MHAPLANLTTFLWQGTASTGRSRWGVSLASSATHLKSLLRRQDLIVKRQWRIPPRLISRNTQTQVGLVFEQIADLLQAHLSLSEALHVLSTTSPHSSQRHFCLLLLEGISDGYSLSQCCLRMQRFCPPLTSETLSLSEHHTQLSHGLRCLAWGQSQSNHLTQQISSALNYPLWILSATLCAATAMCTWALPPLVELLQQIQPQAHLALAFRGARLLAQHPSQTWLTVAIIILGLHRFKASHLTTHVPGVKATIKQAQKQRHTARLLMIANAKLPWAQGVALLAHRTNDAASAWQHVHLKLLQGSPLHQALNHHPAFSPTQCALIEIAERCGRTTECLSKLAEQQQQETTATIARLKQLMEPLLTCGMGAAVAGIMWLFYAPLMNLGDQLWS